MKNPKTDSNHEAWLDDRASLTTVVGSYDSNPFGLHDVHGNVAEWCSEAMVSSGPLPAGGSQPFRGGGWQDVAAGAASAARACWPARTTSWDLGLRPARPVVRD
jgi:formylglycine-generating enzyme required for sulfatase activity